MEKKVALYISSLRRGGAERVIANLAGYLYRSGFQVSVITTGRADHEYETAKGIVRRISEPLPEELRGGRIHNFVARFRSLRAVWKQERPDVILSFIGKNNMMAILTSLGLHIPVAVSVRGEPAQEYYSRWMRFAARHLFLLADGVILQTRRCGAFFPERIRRRTVILRNPVHPDFFRKRYEGEREKTIVAVGRVDENKNHEMLMRAFAGIAEVFPEYGLVIYGEGEKRSQLQHLAEQMGLENRISLPGNIENIANVIYRAGVFVLPSNTEGMPNTLIEAMLMGLTVISTDCPCGGPAELIEHGVNGLLTPVGDVEKMKECLSLVLGNPELADEMGRRAAQISEDYRAEAVYGSWEKYLVSMIDK